MNEVLVTGASGFVGREVIEALRKTPLKITGMGRTDPKLDIPMLLCDITDEKELARSLRGAHFDYIIHLASLPGDTGNPRQMVDVNVNGCQNLLEFARESAVLRFVLASSISAYEWYPATPFRAPDYLPVDENHPCRPRDIYSTTKRMQELMALTYYHQYKVPTTVLRLTAVIGPRGKGGGRGWRAIAEQLREGKEVEIPHFSAEEMCHYVDIRDVARLAVTSCEHPGAVGEIFNCCGPQAVTGSEFAAAVGEVFPGVRAKFGFPWSMAQGGRISFDMSKARTLLGFTPRYDLRASLAYLKEWIDNHGLEKDALKTESFGAGVGAKPRKGAK